MINQARTMPSLSQKTFVVVQLPDDHPEKPKGFFEKTLKKVTATIEAETAALAGCRVEIIDLYGLARVATIQHPLTKANYFWFGALSKWRFIMCRDVQHAKRD